ncbi:hypothetical protein CWB41_05775 [Methylovirgula ligni]|uniref:Uncharacterized protein n=1 Tax=Methylovirgula ligni TaxID=569860 RepID=A0A3D9Z2K5_9HYPH|nr:hypothetical protein [Methylovirgula ligni]QAY95303.1 hypothetical protein CWB41_05775 [Methylovirgula ligni]REF89392.1 hypothetical protein DES32_0613 [Methylovirgula ligni]
MSIADHFDHAPDAGFIRSYDLRSARRQFQVSLILIAILTVSAFALGLLVRFDPPAGVSQSQAPTAAHDVHFAGVLPDLTGFAPHS